MWHWWAGDIPLVPDTAHCTPLPPSLSCPQCPLCPVTWSHTDRYVPLITNQNFEIFQRKSLLGVTVTLWHVTLWSQLCVQHQPGVRAPGIRRGPSGSIPTSQALQCSYSFLWCLYFLQSKIISGAACVLLNCKQGKFLWPDQHFIRTLCGPSGGGGGRGQLRPLPDHPEHRQEKAAEESWGQWPTAGGGVEEYSEIFNKSHGENRAENVSILTGLSWEEHKICWIPRCPNTSISHPGQSIYFK